VAVPASGGGGADGYDGDHANYDDDVVQAPGDLGFGEIFKPTDAAAYNELQKKELKNGRLAMVSGQGVV